MKRNLCSLLFLFVVLIIKVSRGLLASDLEDLVMNKTTELPIAAVTITLSKKSIGMLANDQGYFKLRLIASL